MSNKIKDKQLGMPLGTASARLRKNIMFSLVKECNKDTCFICKNTIETIDEFSIEHIIPWQYNDTSLFWDLSNIAFSHLSCNVRASTGRKKKRFASKLRKIGAGETNWCNGCKEFKHNSLFHKNKSRWNGLNKQCKPCRQKRNKVVSHI